MKGFSNLAINYVDEEEEHGYPSPERELLWRLELLKVRLEEANENHLQDGPCWDSLGTGIRYILPEEFCRMYDIEQAIDLAIKDLEEEYGIGEETLRIIGLIP